MTTSSVTGQRTFTCLGCRATYNTFRSHVAGVPIELWWVGQGYQCSTCRKAAQQSAVAASDGSIEAEFAIFHAANPHVYTALLREARLLLGVGHKKLGMKMLYERLRWQHYMETTDVVFKLPNNYTAHYARLLMKQEPDLAGVFNLAELRSHRAMP